VFELAAGRSSVWVFRAALAALGKRTGTVGSKDSVGHGSAEAICWLAGEQVRHLICLRANRAPRLARHAVDLALATNSTAWLVVHQRHIPSDIEELREDWPSTTLTLDELFARWPPEPPHDHAGPTPAADDFPVVPRADLLRFPAACRQLLSKAVAGRLFEELADAEQTTERWLGTTADAPEDVQTLRLLLELIRPWHNAHRVRTRVVGAQRLCARRGLLLRIEDDAIDGVDPTHPPNIDPALLKTLRSYGSTLYATVPLLHLLSLGCDLQKIRVEDINHDGTEVCGNQVPEPAQAILAAHRAYCALRGADAADPLFSSRVDHHRPSRRVVDTTLRKVQLETGLGLRTEGLAAALLTASDGERLLEPWPAIQ
jgi:hypothetical protein